MRTASKIALTLTTSLLFAKSAFAADRVFLPQNPGEYATFILIGFLFLVMIVGLSIIFVDLWLAIRGHHYRRRIIKELNERYEVLSTDEKERIEILEMEIDKTLDVYRPGSVKYLDAWKEWSNKLAVIKRKFSINWRNGYSPYKLVENAMQRVERAMSKEKRFKEMLEKVKKPREKEQLQEMIEMARTTVEKERHIAAMMWGIYWPEEVAKMKPEKEENTCEV
jgi:hypothetical protein